MDVMTNRREELDKILRDNKGNKTDIISGLSGGRDSLYLLYTLSKTLNLRVKAFTWNHYHSTAEAISSAQKCVKDLKNVDWQTFSFKYNASYKVMQSLLKEYKRFCICPHFMMLRALPVAIDENIPFIAIGYSPDQNERKKGYKFSDRETRLENLITYAHAFENLVRYSLEQNFPEEADEIVSYLFEPLMSRLASLQNKETIPSILILSQYVPWDYDEIESILYDKYQWKMSGRKKLHSNCIFEPIRGHMEYLLKRPFLVDEAKYLVSLGKMTEDQAQTALKHMNYCQDEPSVLDYFTKHVNISKDEYYDILSTPMEKEAEELLNNFIAKLFAFQGFDSKRMGNLIK